MKKGETMEEELFFIVFMIAANAIMWTWQFVSYKLEERGKYENIVSKPFVARSGSRFQRN